MSEVLVAKALAAGLMIGASIHGLAGDTEPATAPPPVPACSAPSASAINIVDRLFTEAPLINTLSYSHERYAKGIAQIATKVGVTLPDDTLQSDIDDATHESFSWLFSTANRYLGQFGVAMTIAKPGELSVGDTNVPTKKQLQSATTEYDITEVVDGLSSFPIQYVHFSGLKRIVIAVHTGDAAYAITGGKHDTVALDVDDVNFGSELADHEDYHLIDAAECGGPAQAANDPAFIALNEGVDIYAAKARSHEITDDELSDVISNELSAEDTGHHKTACQEYALATKEASKVVATSDYSLTDEVEDKAQVGADFGFPSDYAYDLGTRSPIVRSKFLLLMARLYEWQPKVVTFLADVSSRPSSNDNYIPQVKC